MCVYNERVGIIPVIATYTFRLTQASLAIQRAALQCYVRRPVLREMLEWDATSAIRVSLPHVSYR